MKALPNRPRLADMTDQEFVRWQAQCCAALSDAIDRTDSYLSRRRQRGARTSTDIAMERDLSLYHDLLAALSELDELRAAGHAPSSHSGQTGMMLLYDTHDGKLKP